MVRPGKAFLTQGISLNFLPIKIITDLGIEKQRSQLNKCLWKTPFLPTPQAQLQPGHLTWHPGLHSPGCRGRAHSGLSGAQEGGLRASSFLSAAPSFLLINSALVGALHGEPSRNIRAEVPPSPPTG